MSCTVARADEELPPVDGEFWDGITNVDLAYQPYDFYQTGKYTCIETKALDAKLYMLDYWFFPAPDHCRFNDFLMDYEVLQIDFHMYKARAKRKKRIFGYTMLAVGTILGGIAGIKLGKNLK